MKSLIVYDRSRTTTDWACQRRRWWQYEYGGKGVVRSNTSLELFMGTTIHDGLAAIATMATVKPEGLLACDPAADITGFKWLGQPRPFGIDLIADTARKQMFDHLMQLAAGENTDEAVTFANEQAALVEGLLRGFYKQVWPRLMEQYPTIVCFEKEMTYEHDGITFMSKPDLVVEDREGELWYIEYKSTSSKKDGWVNSWNTAVQLHSTIRAVEATIGRKVTGVIVQGLYKGYESYGKQNSPFCYAYHKAGNPPFSHAETLYEYKAGFKRVPVWEMDGGVKKWVEGMPENVLADQFPQTPPIFIKDDMIDNFFAQRNMREREIELAMQMYEHADDEGKEIILNTAFEQNFSECTPGWGRPCPYSQLCHGRDINPIEAGYEWRTPHHLREAQLQEEGESVGNL